ncbi:hypothetical protein LJB42_003418 [Komagataella kurtzmanii]|nr:hypothetical protein LJB42_003418 [Komagataella kurtzmanii]
MARLVRKRGETEPNGPSVKRAKSAASTLASRRASRLPSINDFPKAKTEKLDLFVFGTGSMSELGLGPAASTKEVKRPRLNPLLKKDEVGIVDFAVGGMHTLALDYKNQVWSWGGNDSGVLGRDTSQAQEQLRDMDDEDDDDEDGDLNELESTPGLVEGLPDNQIVQLIATDNLSGVLLENGEVWAWGTFRCNEGLLGFLDSEGIQKTPRHIPGFVNIVQVASGKDHIIGLDNKGIPYAWGNGQQFQLGRRILERTRLQSLEPREFGLRKIKFVGSGEFHSFAISENGKVYAWGLNQFGQCGVPINIEDGAVIAKPTEIEELTGKDVVYITGGEHHSLALTKSGEVYVFGRYDMKEIGIKKDNLPEDAYKDANGNTRAVPVPTKLTTLPKIKAVTAGSHHSLAITESGVVYSWGFADTYAVGLGPVDEDVETPTRIENTATKQHDIKIIGAGGQFSVSGGVKLTSEEEIEKRLDEIENFEDSL